MSAYEDAMLDSFDQENSGDEGYGGFDEVNMDASGDEAEVGALPRANAPDVKKHGKAKAKGKAKKSKKREEDRKYHRFITKVFKTIHPDMQIHPDTVNVINTCIYDILGEVCDEASRMVSRTNKKTLSSTDLQFAIKTLFPAELAKHAEMEGIMAVARAEGMQQDGPAN